MKLYKKFTLISILLISFFILGCSSSKTIEIKEEIKSPNGNYIAYLYSISSGGATVANKEAISIINSKEKNPEDILLENDPNIYLNTNSSTLTIKGIEWENDKSLKVDMDEEDKDYYYIKLKVDIFNHIKINYN